MSDKQTKTEKPQPGSKTRRIVETMASAYILVVVARTLFAVGKAVAKRYVGA